MGWAKHVAKEKRLHGKDIFIRLKQERQHKTPVIEQEKESVTLKDWC